MNDKWPILYRKVLLVKNPKNPVGIVTLWTQRMQVKKILAHHKYAVIGNLYSQAGISYIIRNIFANSYIRFIVVWGADLSRSGQSLLSFMKYGIDDAYTILHDEKKGEIEKDIPKEAIELFREKVKVINLRGKTVSEFVSCVSTLSKKKVYPFCTPRIFPSSSPRPAVFPSEQVGFRVHSPTIAGAWLKAINTVYRYGREKKTRYSRDNALKELLDIHAVIYREDPEHFYVPHYLPCTRKEILQYIPQVISAKKIPGISYTYGQRFREWFGVDQVKEVIRLIKRRPFSKKMALYTTDVSYDLDIKRVDRGDTPCLTQVLFSIQDNKLIATCIFRSHDMVHGWPRNAFALRKLQQMIAKKTGYELGPLSIISHSAHIYADDYKLVSSILKDNFIKELGFTPTKHFEEDPRGNIVIEVENQVRKRGSKGVHPYKKGTGEIVVRLYSPKGGLLLKTWRDTKAKRLVWKMTDEDYFSMPSHMLYVGTELQRAQEAVDNGTEYSQDPVG